MISANMLFGVGVFTLFVWTILIIITHFFTIGQLEFIDPDITISMIVALRLLAPILTVTIAILLIKKRYKSKINLQPVKA